MPVYMTAEFEIKPGAEARVQAAIRAFIDAIQANEPGTWVYTSLQESENPQRFLHYFVFEDESAEQFHRGTEWVQALVGVLYPETLDQVKFTRYRRVAST